MDAAMSALGITILVILAVLYFVPGIVASMQHVENQAAIWLITVFTGWTAVGWIAALVWAIVDKPTHVKQREHLAAQHQQAALMAHYMSQPPTRR